MYYRYNRYDSDDPDIDEEFIDESRAHKVKTTRRPLRSVLYYMKGNESTTALTPVQLPARSKILQASIGTIPILRQQRDWVGGVRKMTIFADVQYYLC